MLGKTALPRAVTAEDSDKSSLLYRERDAAERFLLTAGIFKMNVIKTNNFHTGINPLSIGRRHRKEAPTRCRKREGRAPVHRCARRIFLLQCSP